MYKAIKQKEFNQRFRVFEGKWDVLFNDTYLFKADKKREFIQIGTVSFESEGENLQTPFSFSLENKLPKNLEKFINYNKDEKKADKKEKKALKVVEQILDELGQLFTRNLILEPDFYDERKLELLQYKNSPTLKIIFSDTNAVKNGVLNWFINYLNYDNCFVELSMASQIEIQVKGDQKGFRNRAMSQCALYQEQKIRQKKVPLEFLSLPYETIAMINKKPNFFADRLIMEEISKFKQTRNILDVDYFLLTSDKNLGQFAKLEKIADKIILTYPKKLKFEEEIKSLSFNPYLRTWDICSFSDFIWDMVVTFSAIQLRNNKSGEKIELRSYSPTEHKFFSDKLEWLLYLKLEEKRASIHINDFRDDKYRGWGKISFDKILDLVELIETEDGLSLMEFSNRIKHSKKYILLHLNFLEGIGLLRKDINNYFKTTLFEDFLKAWEDGNLEIIHEIFKNYIVYRELFELIEDKGHLPKIIDKGDKLPIINFSRSCYSHYYSLGVSLGQIYLGEDNIYYGGNNPTRKKFDKVLVKRYENSVTVSAPDFIDFICKDLEIAPIKVENLLNTPKTTKNLFIQAHSAAGAGNKLKHRVLLPRKSNKRFREIALDGGLSYGDVSSFKSLTIEVEK
ncbi:MAG: hypothetical protein ACLFSQ_06670 [Candidatus Zixiibacteriota bacterium]